MACVIDPFHFRVEGVQVLNTVEAATPGLVRLLMRLGIGCEHVHRLLKGRIRCPLLQLLPAAVLGGWAANSAFQGAVDPVTHAFIVACFV